MWVSLMPMLLAKQNCFKSRRLPKTVLELIRAPRGIFPRPLCH